MSPRLPHGSDGLIQWPAVDPTATQDQPGRIDGLYGSNGIPLHARDLHKTAHRVAGWPETVLQRYFGRILDLLLRFSQGGGEPCRPHRNRGADLPLAADIRASA